MLFGCRQLCASGVCSLCSLSNFALVLFIRNVFGLYVDCGNSWLLYCLICAAAPIRVPVNCDDIKVCYAVVGTVTVLMGKDTYLCTKLRISLYNIIVRE